jgi:hypothetical protein
MDNLSRQLLFYLMDQGIVPCEAIVDGDVMIATDRSRHQCFAVMRKLGPSYFVKQIQDWQPLAAQTLEREANCYRLVNSNPTLAPLKSLLPRFYTFDEAKKVLVLELLPDAENLGVFHRRRNDFPIEVAEHLGCALGTYHSAAIQPFHQNEMFPGRLPWILTFIQDGSDSPYGLSNGNSEMLGILGRYPEFSTCLFRLRESWKGTTLIHGDMKWENCVVYPRDAPLGDSTLKIIDWEIADLGDPLWDVGSVMQSYLHYWATSAASSQGDSKSVPSKTTNREVSFGAMQPAIQSFWLAYSSARRFSPSEARHALVASLTYAAARLLQTTFEYLVSATSMNPTHVSILQLSSNIMRQPDVAVDVFLGVSQ